MTLILTPTENLVVELLVARFRLGYRLWTFDSGANRALNTLAAKGVIYLLPGKIPHTTRAGLSESALANHGSQWFRLGLTMDALPPDDIFGADLTTYTKGHIQKLAELTQNNPHLKEVVLNTAHLLLIQMISRNHPVYHATTNGVGAVVLQRGSLSSVEIFDNSADHQYRYRLTRRGVVTDTNRFDDVLAFTSISVPANEAGPILANNSDN